MSYVPANISSAGLSIPSYSDILGLLISKFQGIYGADVYLGTDSLDYQFLSSLALAISDSTSGVQLAYISRAVAFAIGSSLDGLVGLNNITRKSATNSTVELTVTGTPFTLLASAQARDVSGNAWALANPTTIPSGGSISVTATAIDPGPIAANPGDVKYIATPTAGWISVTNPAAALLGLPIETDSQLRARQALSVSISAIGPVSSLIAAIAAVPGVTRFASDENNTGSEEGPGTPPHSFAAVVEGGTDQAIANAIFLKRTVGSGTFGTVSVPITDQTGYVLNINFSRPTYVTIYITMRLQVIDIPLYDSTYLMKVQAALLAYILSLPMISNQGGAVSYSILQSIALSVNPSLTNPILDVLSLFIGTVASPTGTVDIPLAFGQAVTSDNAKILVTL